MEYVFTVIAKKSPRYEMVKILLEELGYKVIDYYKMDDVLTFSSDLLPEYIVFEFDYLKKLDPDFENILKKLKSESEKLKILMIGGVMKDIYYKCYQYPLSISELLSDLKNNRAFI